MVGEYPVVSNEPALDLRAVSLEIDRQLEWHTAGWGTYRYGVVSQFASVEITGISGGSRARPAIETSHAILTSAALMPGCDALEFRYQTTAANSGQCRTRFFITARSDLPGSAGTQLAAAAVHAAARCLPASYTMKAATDAWMATRGWGPLVLELKRHEDVTFPQWDYIPSDFYYAILDRPGDGSGWPQVWQALARCSEPVTVSILFQQAELDPLEQGVLAGVTTDLAIYSESRRDFDLIGRDAYFPACENARVAHDSWQERGQALRRPLLTRVAIRGAPEVAMPVASTLAGAIAANNDHSRAAPPMVVDMPASGTDEVMALAESFDGLDVRPWGGSPMWADGSAPHTLRRMPYLFGLQEATGVGLLPAPLDDQGVPGFELARRVAPRRTHVAQRGSSEQCLRIGRFLHEGALGGEAHVPVSDLSRHTLVVGSSGSGKTTTVLTMLASLWRDHGIPFLVIEPTKREYRTLLGMNGLEGLRVLVVGREDIAPLRLNPLEPPDGVRCEVHMNSLMAILKAALPLTPPLPQLLEESIELAYRRAGWDFDDTLATAPTPPTLRSVLTCFDEVFEQASYVGEARNVAAAMRVRLRSLLRGSRGRVLDTVESVDFSQLLSLPTIVELDEVADQEDKAIIASLLLERIRAEARSQGSSGNKLRHVTVIEEAQRILGKVTSTPSSEAGPGAREAAIEAFSNAIAELRSVGEGFVLSSQSPSRLADAAVDNCATRLIHGLESGDDRETMSRDLSLADPDTEAAARLRRGELLGRWPSMDEPEFIAVEPGTGIDSSRHVEDREVKQAMQEASQQVRQLLPLALCTRDVCMAGCDPDTRRKGSALADAISNHAREAWDESRGWAALQPIAELLLGGASADHRLAYCGAVHLNAEEVAFDTPGPAHQHREAIIRGLTEVADA